LRRRFTGNSGCTISHSSSSTSSCAISPPDHHHTKIRRTVFFSFCYKL
jgi:hypothetical protein